MDQQRPVYLNLFAIKFPVTAIISILHRMSGFLLFLAIPLLLWGLDKSLSSFGDFVELQGCLNSIAVKITVFVLIMGLIYHLIAGIRHLLMDVGIGATLSAGRKGAWLVIGLTIVMAMVVGVWLW